MLDKLIDHFINEKETHILRINNDNCTIKDLDENEYTFYNLVVHGNRKIMIDVIDKNIVFEDQVMVMPNDDFAFYNLMDDLLTFLEILEKTNIIKHSDYDTIVEDAKQFLNILNNQNNQLNFA